MRKCSLTKKNFSRWQMPLRIFKHEQANICATDQTRVFERCEEGRSVETKNTTTRKIKMNITNTTDLKNAIRSGAYTFPGCYPLFFITSDGAALSFDSVKANFRSVLWSIKNKVNDGWRVVGCDANWEDGELTCDHSGERIESAYAE
jgi:hypothetical protein